MSEAGAARRWLAGHLLLMLVASARGMCPSRCACDDSNLLASCEAASLEVIPIQLNPELEVMRLSGNRIATIEYSMAFYTRLRALDLSGNKLKALGPGTFQAQHRLVELNVSNNEVASLASEAFTGLTSLRSLDLSGNRLQGVVGGETGGVWRGLDNLWELDVSRNKLEAISPEDDETDCSPLHNLRTLQLNQNHFSSPPSTCLSQLSSLRHLGLADNLISSLEDAMFPGSLRELISLNLQGNQISSLSPGSLDNLSSLQILDLSDNNLTYIPSVSLAKLSQTLMELDLSGNPIKNVGPVAFHSLGELRRIRLSRLTELLHVDFQTFHDNTRLEEVEIEMCPQLKRIPPRLLHGNTLVARLSLRGNALQTLAEDDLPLRQLRHLALADNPLRCNCSLLWLWKIARKAAAAPSNQSTVSWAANSAGAMCWEPVELRGTPVFKAPEAQVGCEASWATVMMVTGVVLSLFILTCAILFYCGGGGQWCRNEPSDTPSSVVRINGIKEQYPPAMPPGTMYHQHHLLHHHHLGLPAHHHMNMWPPESGNCTDLGADLATRVPPEYEYTSDGGLITVKKPPSSSAIGVYV